MNNRNKTMLLAGTGSDYKNPPIPYFYKHVSGTWDDNFTIESVENGNRFIWIPVKALRENRINDGKINQKFGRGFFEIGNCKVYDLPMSKADYIEPVNRVFKKQVRSIEKYGGFYISAYCVSKGKKGLPQIVKGQEPWTNVNFHKARKLATKVEKKSGEGLTTHLLYGAEYDTMLEWLIEKSFKKADLLNFETKIEKNMFPKKLIPVGCDEKGAVGGIFDIKLRVRVWTQEMHQYIKKSESESDKIVCCHYVIRGGSFKKWCAPAYRTACNPVFKSDDLGFRVALLIE